MRIAEVIGRVTLSKAHPALKSPRLLIALPMSRAAIEDGSADRGEDVIALDELGAGAGSIIGLSEGREAANPFGKAKVPIDAYCACLLDRIDTPAGR